jgi:hypothetical protein
VARKRNEILVKIEQLKKTIERSQKLIEEIHLVSRDLEVQTANGRKLMAKVPGNIFLPAMETIEPPPRIHPG